VTFTNKEDAQGAIDALNETELDGRPIRVSKLFK
jgi:RNA recognition motif-containing protein